MLRTLPSRAAERADLVRHIQDLEEMVDDAVIHHRNEVPFETLEEALDLFDRSYEEMQAKLGSLDEAGWSAPTDFLAPNDSLIMNAPREQLAWLFLFDAIQHRGQLMTHLRPTGGKVPALYGPSADEELGGR